MKPTLLIFGFGYSSAALARLLVPSGWQVFGTTRSEEKCDSIEKAGVTPLVWPGDADIHHALKAADHLLISAAPDEKGDPVLRHLSDEIRSAAEHLKWVGYLSTTGVYGDHKGGWVNEESRLQPSTRRGRWRVAAEEEWKKTGLSLHIFRLAGIYGPGRGPFAKVRAGTARRIIKAGQLFSRIHVEDIAQVLEASIRRPNPGAIYNVCDDLAAPPEDVIACAARLLGKEIPPAEDFETAEMSAMARSFYAESKRVANQKIKEELGVTLRYPNYETGLRALLNAGDE